MHATDAAPAAQENPYTILQGDALAMLRTLEAGSVHCGVTSPPYFGLRRYLPAGHEDADVEIGTEDTPGEYIARLVEVFREFRRVLRADGTLWVDIGDSYANDGKWGGSTGGKHVGALHGNTGIGRRKIETGIKPKNLIGIPWRLAFALQADGWYLRSEIIWAKGVSGQDSLKKRVYKAAIGNGVGEEKARAIASAVDQYNGSSMPENVTDRPSKSHEQLFLFTKSPRYFYDATAIADESVYPDDNRKERSNAEYSTRNRRSVWTINPEQTKHAHFATMPTALAEPCILAGCPAGGTVLDPFAGSGTTLRVAINLGRDAIGIELNPEYVALAQRLLSQTQPALMGI